ncbi:hypothetical protein, partial [Streptomyces sp. NPDC005568]|uniref:hypothetical protein n=1 Tax=Streptomyces sp. NPDC005568 TaxID=3156887 RepID=UPI0033BE897C
NAAGDGLSVQYRTSATGANADQSEPWLKVTNIKGPECAKSAGARREMGPRLGEEPPDCSRRDLLLKIKVKPVRGGRQNQSEGRQAGPRLVTARHTCGQ